MEFLTVLQENPSFVVHSTRNNDKPKAEAKSLIHRQ